MKTRLCSLVGLIAVLMVVQMGFAGEPDDFERHPEPANSLILSNTFPYQTTAIIG